MATIEISEVVMSEVSFFFILFGAVSLWLLSRNILIWFRYPEYKQKIIKSYEKAEEKGMPLASFFKLLMMHPSAKWIIRAVAFFALVVALSPFVLWFFSSK